MRRIEIAVVVGALALSASGCGGSSADVAEGAGSGTDASSASPTLTAETTSPTEAPSISPTHAAELGEPELIQVEGYAYEAEKRMEARAQKHFAKWPSMYAGSSGHLVVQDGEPVAVIALVNLAPAGQLIADRNPEPTLEDAIKGLMGPVGASTYDMVRISGEDVWVAVGDAAVAYSWLHEDTMSWLIGFDPEATEAFVTAYLAEANG